MPNPMQLGSFVGLSAGKPAKSDDDEDMNKPKGDDEDAENTDPKPKKAGKKAKSADRKAKRGKKPDDDENNDDDENCDDEDDDSDDDDEDDSELKEKKEAARTAERARCAAIISHPEAKGRESYAFHLAFGTALPKSQALSLLAASPNAAPSGLSSSMHGFSNVNAGHDTAPRTNKQATASSWDAAAKKAGVKTA